MSKLFRTMLWTGALAFGVAACGDDVTITQPPPPPPAPEPGIRSVTVAPNGASIAIGQKLQMTASVVTDPGAAAPTITWTSSELAKATVDASGLVTAVAAGTVAIGATATSGTSTGSGAATLTITAATTVTPATVSISSITTTPGGTPAELTAIVGAVNVRVNLDRGGEQVQAIQLLLDGAVVYTQSFSSPPAELSAPQVIEEINMPWNSASFNASTGIADFLNGPHTVAVKVITPGFPDGNASPSVNVVSANASFWGLSLEVINGTSATDSPGNLWFTGDVQVTGVPVIFSTATPTIQQVVFSGAACSLVATKTVTAPPYTATWNKASTNSTTSKGSKGVEDGTCTVTAASTLNNNPGPGGTSNTLRLDNGNPSGGVLTLTAQGSADCCVDNWIGKNYKFATGHGASGGAGTSPSDAGIGTFTTTYYIGDALSSTSQSALAAFVAANPTEVTLGSDAGGETPFNNTKAVVAKIVDGVGNTTYIALAVGGNTDVGFDLNDPAFANDDVSCIAEGDINTGNALSFCNDNSDNLSGFGTTPVRRVIFSNFSSSGFDNDECWTSVSGTSGNCLNGTDDNATLVDYIAVTVDGTPPAAGPLPGARYFTWSGFTRDKGGNTSGIVVVNTLEDYTNPVSSNISFPGSLTGGSPASFGASLTDDVDLGSYQFRVGYSGFYIPQAQPTVIGSFGAPLLTTAGANTSVPFMRSLEVAGPAPAGAATVANEAWILVTDVAGNVSTQINNIAAGTFTVPVAADLAGFAGAGGRAVQTFNLAQSDPLCRDDDLDGCAVEPEIVTLTATAVVNSAVSTNNPFPAGVSFYALGTDAATLPDLIGSATSFSVTSAPGIQTYSWKISLPASFLRGPAADPYSIMALGVSAKGDALSRTVLLVLTVD